MRICVVGCGAMGSIYAALLAEAGNNVSVIDLNHAHIAAINARGLRVWGASGDRTVRVPASTVAAELAPTDRPDLVICAVKARFVNAATQTIQQLCGPHTRVLTIQNGLGSAEVLAAQVGSERLIVGIAQGFGASLPEPGCAHHNSMKAIRMGAYDSMSADDVGEIAKLWANAGFDAAAIDNITSMQWGKLICNVAYSAPCAISGLTVGQVLEHPQLSKISRAAAREAYAVAQKLNISLPYKDVDAEIENFAKGMPDAKPSVLLDIEQGRPSEIDVINGAIPREAQKVEMTAPINQALTALVQGIESSN